MSHDIQVASLFGRMLNLLRDSPEGGEEHKAALRALLAFTSQRSITLRVDTGNLRVEGTPIPPSTQELSDIVGRFQAHGVAEIRLANQIPALDLTWLLRALAGDPGPGGARAVEQKLRGEGVTSVTLISIDEDRTRHERRAVRVTDALRPPGPVQPPPALPPQAPAPPPQAPAPSAPPPQPPQRDLGVVPAARGAAYDELQRHMRASASGLSAAINRLREAIGTPDMMNQLEAVQAGINKAVQQDEPSKALEVIIGLIRLEAEDTTPDAQRAFGIALRRILSTETLHRIAGFLIDELYTEDVVTIMRRAGKPGTKVMIDLLVAAPSFAERKAYLNALRQVDEGTDVVTSLLNHHEWFVVRNAADLVGELRVEEATQALGKVVDHPDARVRKSVGIALAKLGTPVAAQHLSKVFRDADADVRVAVSRAIGGKGMSALAMPLLNAAAKEQRPDVQAEYYRALGRIGSPEAVQALVKVAESGGSFLSRRASPARLAAIEALGIAGGKSGVATLRVLTQDRARDVQEAASKALAQARSSGE